MAFCALFSVFSLVLRMMIFAELLGIRGIARLSPRSMVTHLTRRRDAAVNHNAF
jgi:hypothetical protein